MTYGSIATRVAGRPVIVWRPDAADASTWSVQALAAFARAKQTGAAVCLLPADGALPDAVAALTSDDVPLLSAGAVGRAVCALRWRAACVAAATRRRISRARGHVWQEWFVELRRHAGDRRLPYALRQRLRASAHRAFERAGADDAPIERLPRRLLANRVRLRLSDSMLAQARQAALDRGIRLDQPIVALEVTSDPDALRPALDFLASSGYQVVRLADSWEGGLEHPAVLVSVAGPDPLLDLFVVSVARFVICGSPSVQRMADLVDTPSLRLNAADPYEAYPVRPASTYMLRTAIDLESGRVVPHAEWLTEGYFRNRRNIGYRNGTADDIASAVREMHAAAQPGWFEAESQTRFRAAVESHGAALADRIEQVTAYGPDHGFIGHGRLARVQADRIA